MGFFFVEPGDLIESFTHVISAMLSKHLRRRDFPHRGHLDMFDLIILNPSLARVEETMTHNDLYFTKVLTAITNFLVLASGW